MTNLHPNARAEIILGNPATPDCARLGICRIEDDVFEAKKSGCCACHAIFQINEKGQLRIHFFAEMLRPKCFEKHFGRGFFEIETACELPVGLARRLGLPAQKWVIQLGLFGLEKARGGFVAFFEIAENEPFFDSKMERVSSAFW